MPGLWLLVDAALPGRVCVGDGHPLLTVRMSPRGRSTITVTVSYALDDGGETGERVVRALEAQIRAGVDTMKLLIEETDTRDSRRIHQLEVDVVQWRAGT